MTLKSKHSIGDVRWIIVNNKSIEVIITAIYYEQSISTFGLQKGVKPTINPANCYTYYNVAERSATYPSTWNDVCKNTNKLNLYDKDIFLSKQALLKSL